MKPLRIIVLSDLSEAPPADQDFRTDLKLESWTCERHIVEGLSALGHDVRLICLFDSISPLIAAVEAQRPDFVFNIAEQFRDQPFLERNIPGLLELLGIPYSGTGPGGLMLCKNKAISKKILSYHRIPTAKFHTVQMNRRMPKKPALRFPLFVKGVRQEASVGISKASIVHTDDQLRQRIEFVHQSLKQVALVEEYIAGKELYVSLLGNDRLEVMPIRELHFGDLPEGERFATFHMKWDKAFRKRWGIKNRFATGLAPAMEKKIISFCKRAYRQLRIRGYGRLDLRITEDERIYIIEANPNPFIAREEDFAMSAKKAGYSYEQLLAKIVKLGMEDGRI